MIQRQPTLFDDQRISWDRAVEITAQSLEVHGSYYRIWCIAYSGGKDSTALLTIVCHLLASGRIERPKQLIVLCADTRLESPPLREAAMGILEAIKKLGIETKIVFPALDDRFFVYVLGRGVPPPSNTFRWCTPQLKIEPMLKALAELRRIAGEKLLMLTGVRIGESAVRDARIQMACGKNGAECGQGWLQTSTPEAVADTLAPILHWRVCQVWDWLLLCQKDHGWPTGRVALVYGGDEAMEINARTGCIACNLASRDIALETILADERWAHLEPLRELRPLYAELKRPCNRLRKDGSERRKDGALVANPCRMGPLTFEARRMGLARVLDIQRRAGVDLINGEERLRIEFLIESGVWPNGWDGTEPLASAPFENVFKDGSSQMNLVQFPNGNPEAAMPGKQAAT